MKRVLSQRHEIHLNSATNPKPSAVLVPIFIKDNEYHILLTKRTENVRDHKGQISFPGGSCHKNDHTRLDTALRETAEEIGLQADAIEVIGKLDDVLTVVSNYMVSPFVAFIPYPYDFKLQEFEVQELVEVPIQALIHRECMCQKMDIIPLKENPGLHYHYGDRVIWGATARILEQFLGIYARAMADRARQAA
ncbi:MAG: CoA pyrophosphatase [Chloroflexi bacterium]|nr:CoA pyrophosphatase [Chloroflexota bacterium]